MKPLKCNESLLKRGQRLLRFCWSISYRENPWITNMNPLITPYLILPVITFGVPDSTNRWFSHAEQRQYWPTKHPPAKKSSTKVCFPHQKRVYCPAVKDPRVVQNCKFLAQGREGSLRRGQEGLHTRYHPPWVHLPNSALGTGATRALWIPPRVRHWWEANLSHTEGENPATPCTTEVKPLRYRFYLSSRTGNWISQVSRETSRATSAPPIALQNITKALPRVFNNPAALGQGHQLVSALGITTCT